MLTNPRVENSEARFSQLRGPTVFNLVDAPSACLQTHPHKSIVFADSHENMPHVHGLRDFAFSYSIPPRLGDILIKRHDNGGDKSAWEIMAVEFDGLTHDGRSKWRGVISDLHASRAPTALQREAIVQAEIGSAPLHFRAGLLLTREIQSNAEQASARLYTERGIVVTPQLLRDILPSIPGLTLLVLDPRIGADLGDFFDEAFGCGQDGNQSSLLLRSSNSGIVLTSSCDYEISKKQYMDTQL